MRYVHVCMLYMYTHITASQLTKRLVFSDVYSLVIYIHVRIYFKNLLIGKYQYLIGLLSPQFYLRQWSLQLDVPIVSIDYSLAPEAPFPHALEECVLAYAWILNNKEQLGTAGILLY